MATKPVIYDGDMGGDDLWAIAMLLAHRDRFDIRGISTVFGNVSQPQATKNAQNFLHWLGVEDINVVQGSNIPYDGMRPFGDDAYGEKGVGGYILPESPKPITKVDIADWYAKQVYGQTEEVTVFATGPATNLAYFVDKYPELLNHIGEIVFMGGSLDARGKNGAEIYEDGERRIGNMTLHSEFNAYQDPAALNVLLKSGLRMTFMSADATQNMILTPARQERIKALHETYGPALHRMMMAVEEKDRMKYKVDGPFIHDPNVITYALRPDLYDGWLNVKLGFKEARATGSKHDRRGEVLMRGTTANAVWKDKIKDTEAVFDLMEESLKTTIAQAVYNLTPPAV